LGKKSFLLKRVWPLFFVSKTIKDKIKKSTKNIHTRAAFPKAVGRYFKVSRFASNRRMAARKQIGAGCWPIIMGKAE
ncbi:hypothetical protein T4B_1540, partial [Trichinella pseudospiralis]